MATRYVQKARFGRANNQMLYQLLQMQMYLNALQRCVPETVIEKKKELNLYSCTEVTLDTCLDELQYESLTQRILPLVQYSNQYNNGI